MQWSIVTNDYNSISYNLSFSNVRYKCKYKTCIVSCYIAWVTFRESWKFIK